MFVYHFSHFGAVICFQSTRSHSSSLSLSWFSDSLSLSSEASLLADSFWANEGTANSVFSSGFTPLADPVTAVNVLPIDGLTNSVLSNEVTDPVLPDLLFPAVLESATNNLAKSLAPLALLIRAFGSGKQKQNLIALRNLQQLSGGEPSGQLEYLGKHTALCGG